MKRIFFLTIFLFFFVTACQKQKKQEEEKPLTVLCSTTLLADCAEQIGGKYIKAHCLLSEGNPVRYTISAADQSALAKADLILLHGLGLDPQVQEACEALTDPKSLFVLGEALPQEKHLFLATGQEEQTQKVDPFFHTQPSLLALTLPALEQALSRIDSRNAEHYKKNCQEYVKKLHELEQWISEQVATLPRHQRCLLTAYDTQHYYAEAFGLVTLSPQSLLERFTIEKEAFDKEANGYFGSRKNRTLYKEFGVRPGKAMRLMTNRFIQIGGELYSVHLPRKNTSASRYVEAMQHNTKVILSGQLIR